MYGLPGKKMSEDAQNVTPIIGTEKKVLKKKVCECGCGKPTRIPTQNNTQHGWEKGVPLRYVNGHNRTICGGIRKTRIYGVWWNMNQRCYDTNHMSYKNYGARGITVCDEWRGAGGVKAFADFIFSIGWHEKTTLQIDRIENDLGYFPENIRLSNQSVQAFNSRRLKSNNKSGYRGVVFYKRDGNFRSFITINQKQIHLGYYSTPKEAAIARDEYIIENNTGGAHLQVLLK